MTEEATAPEPVPVHHSAFPSPPLGVIVPTIPFFAQTAAPAIASAIQPGAVPAPLGATTGPCNGAFAAFLQSLLPALVACIPAAATPAGLAAIFSTFPKRIEGAGYRALLGGKLRTWITDQVGNDQDGQDMVATASGPLKTATVNYLGGLQAADAQTIITQYTAAVASVSS